jgi:cytochrome P450
LIADVLDWAEIVDTGTLLLFAGHETRVNLITNGMLALPRHPEVLERLRRDPDLTIRMVEELLRYEPPIHMVTNPLDPRRHRDCRHHDPAGRVQC